jgi:hypothetical protein
MYEQWHNMEWGIFKDQKIFHFLDFREISINSIRVKIIWCIVKVVEEVVLLLIL